jgi:zinc protease
MAAQGPNLPKADYEDAKNAPRRIILVDNPQGRQATIRLAVPAYTIASDDKFAGSIAGQILSAGIESRLGKYVRAEKGLTYGAHAFFRAGRHGGTFSGDVDTKPETAAAAIEAMFKVFGDMRRENVTADELADAKRRVAGGMAMEAETIGQQASRRGEGILNGYPADYYDRFPARVAEVTADGVRDVMNKYVKDEEMTIVVVAPAEAVREQLRALGPVVELPMPAARKGPTTAATLR